MCYNNSVGNSAKAICIPLSFTALQQWGGIPPEGCMRPEDESITALQDAGRFSCVVIESMPNKPLRPCLYPGCTELVNKGYCEKHQRPKTAHKTICAWHSWYSRSIWTDKLRPGQLLREPFCCECARYGVRTPATDVDHVEPFRGDWNKFTDPDNLQSLCHSCHSRKTAKELWRPPGSGKF